MKVFLFALICVLSAHGQENSNSFKAWPFIKSIGRDISSPVTTNAAPIFLSTMAVSWLQAEAFEEEEQRWRRETINRKVLHPKLADSLGKLGSGWIPVTYMVGGLLHAKYFSSARSLKNTEYMARTILMTGLMTTISKKIFNVPRPGAEGILESFPSGHTSAAFAFATAISLRHDWYWGATAFLAASAIAYSRVQMNRHYIYDIIGGAGLGISYALGINQNYKKGKTPYIFGVRPAARGKGASLMVSFQIP